MPALKAAIFDRIKAGGDVGATSVEIIADIYGDRREVKPTAIKSHVNQINDALVATDFRIRSDGGRWHLVKEGTRDESVARARGGPLRDRRPREYRRALQDRDADRGRHHQQRHHLHGAGVAVRGVPERCERGPRSVHLVGVLGRCIANTRRPRASFAASGRSRA
jgi:hypothetical protein